MLKYLIKSTNEIRVETKSEVDDLHKKIEDESSVNHWTLSSWTENKKEKKSGGEVVEEYYQVKYCITFNDLKDPERPLSSINYELQDSFIEANKEEEEEEGMPW